LNKVFLRRGEDFSPYPRVSPFSPGQVFPEIRWDKGKGQPNQVYNQIRTVFHDAGLDSTRFNTHAWNPLGKLISPGSTVFLLPNFVMHRRASETEEEFLAKVTNGSVIRAVLDYVILALNGSGKIYLGNAPIQGCNLQSLLQDLGIVEMVEFLSSATGIPIQIVDLRGITSTWSSVGTKIDQARRDSANWVPVDLGRESLLEPFFAPDSPAPKFRVGDYSPRTTMRFHAPGKHVYVFNRRVLEADVIFSIPKLKTHQKVGLTCSLKGCVGAISRKECLAHHRLGPPAESGDEYPDGSFVHRISSRLLDRAEHGKGRLFSNGLRLLGKAFGFLNRHYLGGISSGGWFGNQTAWRMALDIAAGRGTGRGIDFHGNGFFNRSCGAKGLGKPGRGIPYSGRVHHLQTRRPANGGSVDHLGSGDQVGLVGIEDACTPHQGSGTVDVVAIDLQIDRYTHGRQDCQPDQVVDGQRSGHGRLEPHAMNLAGAVRFGAGPQGFVGNLVRAKSQSHGKDLRMMKCWRYAVLAA